MKTISKCGSVLAACLVILALLVGPACAGLCAGTICMDRGASSDKEVSCHHMGHERGAHISRTFANACGSADANVAVANKPTLTSQTENSSPHKKAFAFASTTAILLSTIAAESEELLFSGGHSPGAFAGSSSVQVLRI